MAEVNKGPLSTILVHNDSTWRARDRGKKERERRGVDNNNTRSYAGLILSYSFGLQNVSSSTRGL